MSKFSTLMVALILSMVFVSSTVAGPLDGSYSINTQHHPNRIIEYVQYGRKHRPNLCENWHRECGRLWQYGTPNWNACMNQPAAIYDCSDRRARPYEYSRSRGHRQNLCENWHRECTRLHGRETRNWYSCMNQPGAIQDCSRRY